jgi:hypothetical protein
MRENPEQALRLAVAATIFVILAVSPSETVSQESSSPQTLMSAAVPFAGCYELQLGRWWPWSMGDDTKFVTPPQHIELRLQRGTELFERNGLLIRAIPPSASRRSSFWLLQGRDGVDLIWTSGFSGVSLRLKKHEKELRGWAHAFFDSPRPPHLAHVRARPIPCSSAQ